MSSNYSGPRPPPPPVATRAAARTEQNFEDIFYRKLLPALLPLEKDRKNIVFLLTILTLFTILWIGYYFESSISKSPGYIFLAFGVPTLFAVLVLHPKIRDYKKLYKSRIVKVLIEESLPGFIFDHEKGISLEKYFNSGLFPRRPDRYKSEDFVAGQLGNTPFYFSEIHSQFRTTTTTKNGTRTQWHTIFRGIFFVADFNKHIKGTTFVLEDLAEKMMGGFLGGLFQKAGASLQSRGELVKLENVEFEKNFVVFSNDQVEARYILSPFLMEKILGLKTIFKRTPNISFRGNHVYVALSMKDFFEPSFFTSVTRPENLRIFLNIVKQVAGIVEELDLNTRIWSKS